MSLIFSCGPHCSCGRRLRSKYFVLEQPAERLYLLARWKNTLSTGTRRLPVLQTKALVPAAILTALCGWIEHRLKQLLRWQHRRRTIDQVHDVLRSSSRSRSIIVVHLDRICRSIDVVESCESLNVAVPRRDQLKLAVGILSSRLCCTRVHHLHQPIGCIWCEREGAIGIVCKGSVLPGERSRETAICAS